MIVRMFAAELYWFPASMTEDSMQTGNHRQRVTLGRHHSCAGKDYFRTATSTS
jgi:hypothetical protein